MKNRQLKKIINTYVLDTDEELMVPPSVCRQESKGMIKYFSKAWRISNPKEAKEIDEAIEKAAKEAQEKLDKEAK